MSLILPKIQSPKRQISSKMAFAIDLNADL